jgi:hypothetical protein
MNDNIRVSPEEVLRVGGAEDPVRPGTFLQHAGLKMARWFGIFGGIVMLILLVKWWVTFPTPPTLPVGIESEKAKAALENYRQLQEISLDPILKICDSIIVRLLLPVFTTILGYIFGSREASQKERS